MRGLLTFENTDFTHLVDLLCVCRVPGIGGSLVNPAFKEFSYMLNMNIAGSHSTDEYQERKKKQN
jgi:hypothetical protein